MGKKNEKVWLAVAGVVENSEGQILVVMKNYSGLIGQWSFPAGFVKEAETIDEAVVREILEETGINAEVEGIIAIRSGVIKDVISDNMIVFHLKTKDSKIVIQERELEKAAFLSRAQLLDDPKSSLLIKELLSKPSSVLKLHSNHSPGAQFHYTKYHVFN